MASSNQEHADQVEALRRWQDSGGTWQVLARSADRVTISLCRCDGGEELERLTSTDPSLLAFLADRPDSESWVRDPGT